MPKQEIRCPKLPAPSGHFAQAIEVEAKGRLVFISGMVAKGADGKVVGIGDIEAQTRQVCENVKAAVEAAGGTMDDIVYNAIFLKDLADYAKMNEVYAAYFPKDPPARYCIRADLVRPEFLVEIGSVAYLAT